MIIEDESKKIIFSELINKNLEDVIIEIKSKDFSYKIISIDGKELKKDSLIGLIVKDGKVVNIKMIAEKTEDVDIGSSPSLGNNWKLKWGTE